MDFDFHGQLPSIGEADVLWDVVEEHMEEASFLWIEWERAQRSATLAPVQVQRIFEDRLAAHLEGLALSGAISPARLSAAAARAGDEGASFAVVHALLHRGRADGVDAAVELLATAEGADVHAVGRAFALAPARALLPRLPELLRHEQPRVRAAALSAACRGGVDVGPPLADGLGDRDADVRRAALAAVTALRRREHLAAVRALLADPDPGVRRAAMEAGLILGAPDALAACRAALCEGDAAALLLLALAGDGADVAAILRALDAIETRAAALFALGFIVAPEAAEASAAACADAALGPVAAEAFAAVTGLDLVREGLASAAAPPSADREEAGPDDIELRAEAQLPVPDPAAIRARWAARSSWFTPRAELGTEALLAALSAAPMRRRPPLATQLAIRSRGAVQLDTTAWLCDQLASLARLRAQQGAR